MSINEAYQNLKSTLSKIYQQKEAANIAELIIENISGFTKTDRILNKQFILNDEQQKLLSDYTSQLLKHKPVQYVLHEAWFAGMKFYVDENVLIPRPETEELVDWIIANSLFTIYHLPFILDIGTGSGCIAIALKKKLQQAEMHALDKSKPALHIAELNAKQNNVHIHFFEDDILHSKYMNSSSFDVIVSNPPYIAQKESVEINKNVMLYEPHSALFVPDNTPILFYENIANFALLHLKKNGWLYFEINESYANEIASLLQAKAFHSIQIKKDLQGKNRMMKASIKS